MERPNTVAGLIEMHREIAGKIEATRRELNRMVADLEAVEHAVYLFDPGCGPQKKSSQPWGVAARTSGKLAGKREGPKVMGK
jgi:hypothetical protein